MQHSFSDLWNNTVCTNIFVVIPKKKKEQTKFSKTEHTILKFNGKGPISLRSPVNPKQDKQKHI